MRAARYDQPGGPDNVRIVDVPIPNPGPAQVRVRVHAAGVNPVDAKIVAGDISTARRPCTLGIDFAGIVEAGEAIAPGTRVVGSGPGFGVARDGAFAEYVVSDAASIVTLPSEVSFEQGAALGVVFLTAWMAVFDASQLRHGETAIVHGAGGGVGQAIIQLASRVALATVVAVVSGDEGARRARGLGAHATIDRRAEDVFDAIARHTSGRGPDVVFDVVGGVVFERSARALAPFGRLVSIGVSSGMSREVTLDLAEFYRNNRRILGVGSAQLGSAARAFVLGKVVEKIATKEIDPPSIDAMPLEFAAEALRRTLAGEGTHGKIVLTV